MMEEIGLTDKPLPDGPQCDQCGATMVPQGSPFPQSSWKCLSCGWTRGRQIEPTAQAVAGTGNPTLDELIDLRRQLAEKDTQIAALEEKLKTREGCSAFIMRDCPTHGESKELKALREQIAALHTLGLEQARTLHHVLKHPLTFESCEIQRCAEWNGWPTLEEQTAAIRSQEEP